MNSCLAILLLLAAAAALSQGATINRAELRCQCINTQSKPFSSKQIANIELIPQGPHCVKMEVIATLKDGNQICLDFQAKWVKKIIHSLLHRSSNSK